MNTNDILLENAQRRMWLGLLQACISFAGYVWLLLLSSDMLADILDIPAWLALLCLLGITGRLKTNNGTHGALPAWLQNALVLIVLWPTTTYYAYAVEHWAAWKLVVFLTPPVLIVVRYSWRALGRSTNTAEVPLR